MTLTHGPVAQGIEHRFPKPGVDGSNPPGVTSIYSRSGNTSDLLFCMHSYSANSLQRSFFAAFLFLSEVFLFLSRILLATMARLISGNTHGKGGTMPQLGFYRNSAVV